MAGAPATADLLHGLSDEDAKRLAARFLRQGLRGSDAVAEAWLMGATAVVNILSGRRTCRICGCWELAACEGGCAWTEGEADLCTACNVKPADA